MKLWLKNPAYTPDLAHKLKIAAEPVSQKPLWAHVFFSAVSGSNISYYSVILLLITSALSGSNICYNHQLERTWF